MPTCFAPHPPIFSPRRNVRPTCFPARKLHQSLLLAFCGPMRTSKARQKHAAAAAAHAHLLVGRPARAVHVQIRCGSGVHAPASAPSFPPCAVLGRCPRRPVHIDSACTRTRELIMRYSMYTDTTSSPTALTLSACIQASRSRPFSHRDRPGSLPTNTTSYATNPVETRRRLVCA